METPIALNIAPINAPHKDLDYLPLADKDFQIKDLSSDKNHLQAFCQVKESYLNKPDIFGLWESNIPMYFLPSIHVFPKIIHHYCANYDPIHRAIMSPSQTVLFPITSKSINEMIQFHPTEPLAPLSMGYLLEKASKLPTSEINRIAQTFMLPKHQLKGPPLYL